MERGDHAYESALELDPELNDAIMKEQLLNGYLRRIIQMLENDSTAVEDIEMPTVLPQGFGDDPSK
jgi:hypothetical protein